MNVSTLKERYQRLGYALPRVKCNTVEAVEAYYSNATLEYLTVEGLRMIARREKTTIGGNRVELLERLRNYAVPLLPAPEIIRIIIWRLPYLLLVTPLTNYSVTILELKTLAEQLLSVALLPNFGVSQQIEALNKLFPAGSTFEGYSTLPLFALKPQFEAPTIVNQVTNPILFYEECQHSYGFGVRDLELIARFKLNPYTGREISKALQTLLGL